LIIDYWVLAIEADFSKPQRTQRRRNPKYEARSAKTTADKPAQLPAGKNPKQIQRTKIRIPQNEIAAHSAALRAGFLAMSFV
jgi:hypothetical protein